jgi:signal peptidase I
MGLVLDADRCQERSSVARPQRASTAYHHPHATGAAVRDAPRSLSASVSGVTGAGSTVPSAPDATPAPTPAPKHWWQTWTATLLITVLLSIGAFIGLRVAVVQPFYIPSASMEPTLHGCPGCTPDRVLVDKVTYRFRDPHRGEVVVFDRPANLRATEDELIKRVIGLPGETVSGHDNAVYIDGRRLDEPYVNAACNGTRDFTSVVVPKGEVFMMGDNRCDSSDSRVFGPVRINTIVGRAFLILWPPGRIHWL